MPILVLLPDVSRLISICLSMLFSGGFIIKQIYGPVVYIYIIVLKRKIIDSGPCGG